jgi:PAS domain S-box-containing protein
LHVDDDRALLDLAKLFLEKPGDLVIDTAAAGDTARKMLQDSSYDAIVSDYHMPGCSGIELLRFIRRTDARTPFLFFSDHSDEEAVLDALSNGADFFLPKRIQVRPQFIQLDHAIRESVMRRRAEQEHERISSVLRIREAAVRSSLCPLALCDAEGRIQYANPASLQTWGYGDESEVIGRHATDFVTLPEITQTAISDLLQQKTWSGEALARRKDGSTFNVRVYVNILTSESGSTLGFVASFTDLTRQKRARARLESYIRDIRFVSEKANEMNDFPPEGDIFASIADALSALVPPGSIVFVSSVHADSMVRVEAARGTAAFLAEIERLIGRPVTGLTFQSTSQGLASMLPRSFIEVEGGIHTITFGQLSPEISQGIQNLPFIGKVIGTGLSWRGRVNGITVIILPPGVTPENLDVLDLFIRHCSAVLQRRHVEQMLREGRDIPCE